MSEREQELEKRVEELQANTINIRFDNVEKQLTEIKTLLKEVIDTGAANHKLALEKTEVVAEKVRVLEDKERNCPVHGLKLEVRRFGNETKFLRYMFANPYVGITLLTFYISLIVILIAVFGPEALTKILTLFK